MPLNQDIIGHVLSQSTNLFLIVGRCVIVLQNAIKHELA
jgi:hypothetical protein